MSASVTPQQRKGRQMLVFLVVLFSLPVVTVMGMYLLDYRPGGASHGELMTPPKPLNLVAASTAQGRSIPPEAWKKKWHLVVIAQGECNADCQNRIHQVRQIHVSLNKEIERVERVLFVTHSPRAEALAEIQREYPDLLILTGPGAETLVEQFPSKNSQGDATDSVFVVDPLGNVIMRYPQGFDPKGMQKDMTRLLKYSWVG